MVKRGLVEKIVDGGWGLIRDSDEVVLLNNVIEHEEVEYQVKEIKKGIIWGEVNKIITPSTHRIPSSCIYFPKCGGCVFQHITYDYQTKIKENIFAENLKRIGKTQVDIETFIKSPPYNYRIRAKFKSTDGGKIGYIQKGTNNILPIESCLIVKEKISNFLSLWNQNARPPFFFQFDVLLNNDKLYIYLPHPPSIQNQKYLKKFEQSDIYFFWETNKIESVSKVKIAGFEYLISPAVFFQVNDFLWDHLLQSVQKYLSPVEHSIDLYSGIGFFIPLLRLYSKDITAVENHNFSTDLLTKQFPGVNLFKGNAERFTFPPADLLIIDPPRQGLSKQVMNKILDHKYKRIIYISCYSASFARDCRILLKEGKYQIKGIQLLDLFPQTPHLESIALLQR